MQPQNPAPSPEQKPAQSSPEQGIPQPLTPETQPEKPSQTPSPEKAPVSTGDVANQNVGAPAMPTVPKPVAPASDSPTDDTTLADDLPAIADDTDLIEKEWVQKSKQIIESTKDDPHQQNKEMGRFKAGYIKKRYNKDVKSTA